MSTTEQERDHWDARAAAGEQSAIDAIAADESAWSGEILEQCYARLMLPIFDRAPNDAGRILDLGCGMGRLTIPFAQRHPSSRFIGVDISEEMLDLARRRSPQPGNTHWLSCDGRTLPADLGRIDAAYSMIMMQHIPRAAQAGYIAEVGKALVRRGVFVFQVLEGEQEEFLGHRVLEGDLGHWCFNASLKVVNLERTAPFNDPDADPIVLWVTAVKR